MKKIKGVSSSQSTNSTVCFIEDFTDEIKELLKQQLTAICHGAPASKSDLGVYNYKNTLDEFLTRYESKDANTQKGMIGEMLSHILINELFKEYKILSPFFNQEERSIKKGFDVVLFSCTNSEIWITEVKSGELHNEKDATATTNALLNTAKRDLMIRLNNSNHNRSLWLNALNGARAALEDQIDLKEVVLKLLDNHSTLQPDFYGSQNINVFLISALFASLADRIEEAEVTLKANGLQQAQNFKKVFVLSLQKETYKKVHEFLQLESVQCQN